MKNLLKILILILVLVALTTNKINTNQNKNSIITLNIESTLKTQIAFAEGTTGDPYIVEKPDILPGPANTDKARNYLTQKTLPKIAIWLIGLIGGVSVLFIVIGGIRLATAWGEEDDIKKGKDQIKYAIIGFLVSILSYSIVSIITNITF